MQLNLIVSESVIKLRVRVAVMTKTTNDTALMSQSRAQRDATIQTRGLICLNIKNRVFLWHVQL